MVTLPYHGILFRYEIKIITTHIDFLLGCVDQSTVQYNFNHDIFEVIDCNR